MLRIEKLMEKHSLTPNELVRALGTSGRTNSVKRVLNKEESLSSLSFDIISSLARAIGVPVTVLLEDYELDGTASQVLAIKRLVCRILNSISRLSVDKIINDRMVIEVGDEKVTWESEDLEKKLEVIRSKASTTDKMKNFANVPSYVLGIYFDKLSDTEVKIKENSEFKYIERGLPHFQQNRETLLDLNNAYVRKNGGISKWNRKANPDSIISGHKVLISHATAAFVYTPVEDGGILRTLITVFDKYNEIAFDEVYTCEWIDTDELKELVYHKVRNREPLNSPHALRGDEKQLSELEYLRAIQGQFPKFKIAKT